MEKAILFAVLISCLSVTVYSTPPTRFQAEKFLDMLARTFDSKVAYLDLLHALQKRLNLDPLSNHTTNPDTSSTGSAAPGGVFDVNCPVAPYQASATVTYTVSNRPVGSRAFYECNKGFTGSSLFIQCMSGGTWSPPTGWNGCLPVNCGHQPHLTNADAMASGSNYGSVVVYKCRQGYQMNSAKSNITCLETGVWETPTFKCDQVAPPAAPSNNGFNLAAMSAMMSAMGGEGGRSGGGPNPMLASMMNNMPGMGGFPSMGGSPSTASGGMNNIMDMMKMMGGAFQPNPPPTTTTPAPPAKSPFPAFPNNQGGFQLPVHLKNLLPNGLAGAQGFKPQDLVALTSAGLGSAQGAAGPRDITSLLSSMNPMAMLTGGMGGQMPGGRGRQPVDPEKMAEQREDMMMRAAMATAMKSMMGGNQRNGTNANGGMNNAIAMMALQNGLGGGGGGGGAGGMDALIPMMMGGGMPGLFSGMGGAGGGGGLFSGLFGGA